MELVKVIVVVGVFALLLVAGVVAIARKAPPLRLIALFGILLIAVLLVALGQGNLLPELFDGGTLGGLAR
ncbi:hypothetical protein [Amycolatopsis sp. lyj-23]|uniref:hypothetical protein n=1 Tax=Amycolatopsis sp. lyj-23 TaxID=2789283 RepID=UPI0039788C2A